VLVIMGNSTARDRSRIQAEPESESGATTIEAPPTANDVGIICISCNGCQKLFLLLHSVGQLTSHPL